MGKVLYTQEFDNGKRESGYIPTDLKGAKALSPLFAGKLTFYEEDTTLSKSGVFVGIPSKASVKIFSKEQSKYVFLNFLIDESKTDEDDIQSKLKNITIGGVKLDNVDPKISGGE